jgi:hypothetical protein
MAKNVCVSLSLSLFLTTSVSHTQLLVFYVYEFNLLQFLFFHDNDDVDRRNIEFYE